MVKSLRLLPLLVVFAIVSCLSTPAVRAAPVAISERLYEEYEGDPCVLLLDHRGGYGCRSMTRAGATGDLYLLENVEELKKFLGAPPSSQVVVVLPAFLLALDSVVADLTETKMVAALVLLTDDDSSLFRRTETEQGYSPLPLSYWNPSGLDLVHEMLPLPIWKLTQADSVTVRKDAKSNREANKADPIAGEVVAFMHPEVGETSLDCLRRGTCQALGGHSTWTTLGAPLADKETVMVAATMDGVAMFQQQTLSANHDMSGTVAAMVALEALSTYPASAFSQQVLFAFFDAESWGNLGSSQFIRDVRAGQAPVKHFSLRNITSLIEPKQVGHKGTHFYVHTHDHLVSSNSAAEALRVLGAHTALAETPGLPPSAAQTFVQAESTLGPRTVVLTDHSGPYKNKFAGSIFDNRANVDDQTVCDAASLLVQAVVRLALPSLGTNDAQAANCTLVTELLDCLIVNETCATKMRFLTETAELDFPSHYPSVFQKSRVSSHQKFINEWVSHYSTLPPANPPTLDEASPCDLDKNKCKKGQICREGTCRDTFTQFHEATSPAVKFVQGELFVGWELVENAHLLNVSIWAEATWSPIGLRTFHRGGATADLVFLLITGAVCIAHGGAFYVTRRFFFNWFRVL